MSGGWYLQFRRLALLRMATDTSSGPGGEGKGAPFPSGGSADGNSKSADDPGLRPGSRDDLRRWKIGRGLDTRFCGGTLVG